MILFTENTEGKMELRKFHKNWPRISEARKIPQISYLNTDLVCLVSFSIAKNSYNCSSLLVCTAGLSGAELFPRRTAIA